MTGVRVLRRVESGTVAYTPPVRRLLRSDLPGYLTARYGKRQESFFRLHMTPEQYQQTGAWQQHTPWCYGSAEGRNYWLFRGLHYCENEGLDAPSVKALILTRAERRGREVERAKAVVARGRRSQPERRGYIPPELRQYIFERDDHACRRCGSRHELQLDHIIPVALGGSSEPGNLEVLCGPCNRTKGAALA